LLYNADSYRIAKWDKKSKAYILESELDVESEIWEAIDNSLLSNFLERIIKSLVEHLASENGITIGTLNDEEEVVFTYNRFPMYVSIQKKHAQFFDVFLDFVKFLGDYEDDFDLFELFKRFQDAELFTALQEMNVEALIQSMKSIMAVENL